MAESHLPVRVQQYNLQPRVAITTKLTCRRGIGELWSPGTNTAPPVRCSTWSDVSQMDNSRQRLDYSEKIYDPFCRQISCMTNQIACIQSVSRRSNDKLRMCRAVDV
jgi:hypothetical protein